jgi:UDP-glucose 4-epimerase
MRPIAAVTGGSGFVGSNVVDALLAEEFDVRVIDRRRPHRCDVTWCEVDILDRASLTDALAGVGPVFHLAAVADVNDVFADPTTAVSVNVHGTACVLDAARTANTSRVVLASTVWVYGATRGEFVDETTPFDPDIDRHVYVSTKIAAEMLCRDFSTLYKRPFTILRYGIPYGPRMRDTTVMSAFFRRALAGEPLRIDGDGRQARNFVYVEDLARAHVLALRPAAENLIVNVDGPEPVTIRRLAELTSDLVGGVPVEFGPVRPGDLATRIIGTERAREVLGWEPAVTIDDGLKRSFHWYINRELDEVRHG